MVGSRMLRFQLLDIHTFFFYSQAYSIVQGNFVPGFSVCVCGLCVTFFSVCRLRLLAH